MIIVFGSINIDLIGHAPHLMTPGETVLGSHLEVAPGGKGANQALAASRAGAEVKMIGCVGHDDFAVQALALLSAAEIDLSHVRRMDRHTGTALVVVDSAGENMITVLPGANGRLGANALERAGIGPDDTLVLQLETPLEGIVSAAQKARSAGARVVLNLAPFHEVPKSLFETVTVLVLNQLELESAIADMAISVYDTEAAAQALAERYDTLVVATLGGEGVLAAKPDGAVVRVAGHTVAPIDTTGAGDTFVGYLAAGLAAALDLETALARANIAAALACTAGGAQPAIPDHHLVADEMDRVRR